MRPDVDDALSRLEGLLPDLRQLVVVDEMRGCGGYYDKNSDKILVGKTGIQFRTPEEQQLECQVTILHELAHREDNAAAAGNSHRREWRDAFRRIAQNLHSYDETLGDLCQRCHQDAVSYGVADTTNRLLSQPPPAAHPLVAVPTETDLERTIQEESQPCPKCTIPK